MRISADKNDIGHDNFAFLLSKARAEKKKIIVYLDGKEIKECVTADEELGFVIYNVLDEKGLPQVDPTDSNCVWQERAKGKVELRLL